MLFGSSLMVNLPQASIPQEDINLLKILLHMTNVHNCTHSFLKIVIVCVKESPQYPGCKYV